VPYRDADLIVTLFTRKFGKLSALARSARRSRKRFGGALGHLSVIEVELLRHPSRDLSTLAGAEVLRDFSLLATDMVSFAHASYATELTRELSVPEQPDVGVWDALLEFFGALRDDGHAVALLRGFELRLLDAVGLAPVFDRCVGCGETDALERGTVFDGGRGGVLCAACGALARGGVRTLSPMARRFLLSVQVAPTLAACRRVEAAKEVQVEARGLMLAVIGGHVPKALRSLDFVRKLRVAPPPAP